MISLVISSFSTLDFVVNQFQSGNVSYNKGESKRLTWTEGKIAKARYKRQILEIVGRPSPKFERKKIEHKSNAKTSEASSLHWYIGLCMSVIIIVALLGVRSNSRYITSRELLSRRRRPI